LCSEKIVLFLPANKIPMRVPPFFVCLFFSGCLHAQTMLSSAEWCALGHKTHATWVNITDNRSDSFDITHTRIRLDVRNAPELRGWCALHLNAKMQGISDIRLDLEALTVDSVRWNGQTAPFTRQSPHLWVSFPGPLNNAESGVLEVFYQGTPVKDASGWGGVYNQGDFYYNLGVGFDADPHSFGRAWFPCFDNFVERSTFETTVITSIIRPAYCNGLLSEELPVPGGLQRTWTMNQPIPSYLACFATGPYVSFKRQYSGENGPIPVEIATPASDTNKVAATFQHLPQAIAGFEHWYGPYRWDKIGYSLVPFTSGAMEHASNIAIMRVAIDGSLNYETLWAHELSHHWWGDLATCSTAEDMWLNEGWAVFSEHLFTEWVYGREAYLKAVGDNFNEVLQKAHLDEGGYRAVSGIPHQYTYGKHVYNKGAVVAHNLRTYLGDSLFRTGIRHCMDNTQFQDWSSAEFRDKLSAATGKDLTDFFDDWVFAPGFAHFSIDSFYFESPGIDTFQRLHIFVKQKRRGAPHLYQNVPLEFTLVHQSGQRDYYSTLVSGENTETVLEVPLSADPVAHVWVNTRFCLTLARLDRERVMTNTGNFSFAPARMDVRINAPLSDTLFLRVENHFAMPDTAGMANPYGFKLTNRYWSVRGDWPAGTNASFTIFYDGRGQQDQFDTELFAQTSPSEDSIVPLYRPGPGYPWTLFTSYVKNTLGSTTDRYGTLRLDQALPGEYTIAKGALSSSTNQPLARKIGMKVSPNPASTTVSVEAEKAFDRILITGLNGAVLRDWQGAELQKMTLNISHVPPGLYWISVFTPQGMATEKLVISR
jgi:hypothetical protein